MFIHANMPDGREVRIRIADITSYGENTTTHNSPRANSFINVRDEPVSHYVQQTPAQIDMLIERYRS